MRLTALVCAAALLTALLPPGVAAATWSASGGGPGRSSAATVAPPTGVTVAWDPTVHVSWTATASSWAAGHRVLRAVAPTGPYSTVAELPGRSTATLDDRPGAGSWYYRVVAYAGTTWTSTPSAPAGRVDPTYVFSGTSGYTATGCAAATSMSDMKQGFVPTGAGVSVSLSSGTTITVCSDTFTTGQSLAAGTTTVTLHTSNDKSNKSCDLGLALLRNGSQSLGTRTGTIPAGQTAASPMVWSFPTTGAAFSTGDRLNLRLTPSTTCSGTMLYAAGANVRSRLTLPG